MPRHFQYLSQSWNKKSGQFNCLVYFFLFSHCKRVVKQTTLRICLCHLALTMSPVNSVTMLQKRFHVNIYSMTCWYGKNISPTIHNVTELWSGHIKNLCICIQSAVLKSSSVFPTPFTIHINVKTYKEQLSTGIVTEFLHFCFEVYKFLMNGLNSGVHSSSSLAPANPWPALSIHWHCEIHKAQDNCN